MGRVSDFVQALCLAGVLLGSSGCYKTTHIDDRFQMGVTHDEWVDHFVFGLVGTAELDVRSYCQTPSARVRTGGNFGTVIVSLVTIGIYTPRRVLITCPAGAPSAPGADQGGAP